MPDRKDSTFSEVSGPAPEMIGLEPLEILLKLLGENFIEDLVEETNVYAREKGK